ncbi:MAG: hypothetical protein JO020_06370 [Chloroflexi bacterium]|nr:hypothetical protein [Chloroflexota bacterium]MBV9893772.1 hypothetical protein [Chloroflexota bacterium]
MRDTVNMLREGVPAVALVHEPFRRLAHMAAGQVGMANAPLLIYPRDLVSEETPEDLEAKAREVANEAVQLLLSAGKS